MRTATKVAAGAVAALGAAALLYQAPAGAVAGPTALTKTNFAIAANYHQFDAAGGALVAKLGTASVDVVMASANHTRTAITPAPTLAGYAGGFRFDSGDNSDCKNSPQGITTSRDAVGKNYNGRYGGHQLVVVSWNTSDECNAADTRSRITLIDWDANYPNTYRKILLVQPTGTAAAPNFTDVPVHAGGIAWYGDYLYVADTTRGMRIFDMRKILRTSIGGAAGQIGRQPDNNTYYAHNYGYVLPQIGSVTAVTAPGTVAMSWSSISLDRVSRSIVMTEYTCQSACGAKYEVRPPRAIRFPFAAGSTTFAPATAASEALQLPWYQLNGVASHNNRWWFNSSGDKRLYYWKPGATATSYPWVSGGESISYWEDPDNADLLWSLRETPGARDVFAVKQGSYS